MVRKALSCFSMSILVLTACSTVDQSSPFINAEPEIGSIQSRPPRTLRLYFEQLPDVARSEVTHSGPNGELNLRGLHTMDANDLMMEIYDEVENGQYTVNWQTYVGDDPDQYSGSYLFTVLAE